MARHLRGMSQEELSRKVGVTAAAISQFEAGAARPAAETLQRLSLNLKVGTGFLTRRSDVNARSSPFFRALRRTKAAERNRAAAYAVVLGEVGELLDRHVELPTMRIERLLDASASTTDAEIEGAAERARDVWGLASEPIPDVVNVAESRGVLVAAVGDFEEGMDAFSLRAGVRPVVVLCTGKGVASRRRFDMAHELGHLVLHDDLSADQGRQESQAHRFAAALLMPAGAIHAFLPRRPNDLRSVEEASRIWGVSMQAVLFRARQLGALSEPHYIATMKRLGAAGWRRREPIEIGPLERPQVLSQAVAALPQAGTSFAAIADELGLPVGRLARMLAVPEDQEDPRHNVIAIS